MRDRLCRHAACSIALLALIAGLMASSTASAGPTAEGRRALIVLVDSVSFADVAGGAYPGFAALARRGSIGLSTVPLAAEGHNAVAYAVIGNGTPIPARSVAPELSNGFEPTEQVQATSASAAYARNTGTPTSAGIVNPDIVAFTRMLSASGGPASAGGLGSSLRTAGASSALLGNADGGVPASLDRSAMLVAMESAGTVDTGAVAASVVTTDPSAPLGVRTDFERLLALTSAALADRELVVVETGDLQRARVEAAVSTPQAAARSHARALRATDAFLQRIVPLADENTLLIVVSPSVPASDTDLGRSLAPVWAVGGRFPAGGTITSTTTRQAVVLTLYDIAPTVLAHLGVKPAQPMAGLPLAGRADPGATPALLRTLERAGALHAQRAVAVATFILAQTLLLFALCVPWLQRRVVSGRWWWVAPYASGSAALSILLAPALGSPALGVALGAMALVALALSIGLAALRDRVLALGLLSTATAGVLALDLAAGTPLARWSFLGYDIVVGGRFYGIGNEYEGVLIGTGVVGAACLVALAGRHRRLAVGAVGAGCLALIGMFALPRLGADAGGALAAAIGVGVTFYGFAGGRFTWRRMLLLAGALVALGVVGIALASSLGDASGSHVGRFLGRIASGDVSFASGVVLGKLRANLHLLATSPWRWVLAAAAAALAVLGLRYRGELRSARITAPDLSCGVPGLVAGGAAVLTLNDSGVIALATLAPFAVLLVLTLIAIAKQNPADGIAP